MFFFSAGALNQRKVLDFSIPVRLSFFTPSGKKTIFRIETPLSVCSISLEFRERLCLFKHVNARPFLAGGARLIVAALPFCGFFFPADGAADKGLKTMPFPDGSPVPFQVRSRTLGGGFEAYAGAQGR